ncbi:MAG: polyprenol monophosphomannose synthase [Candidatus Cloacimonadales bacterium]
MKALVIIPTYNEAENIQSIISAVLAEASELEILVVDDNSPDGTAKLVQEMQENSQRIHLLQRAGKQGLGSAYVAGFKYALNKEYDCIIEMDADFSHDPAELPRMLKEIEQNDLVIGSRYLQGVNVVNWPLWRLILSKFASLYVQVITGMPIADPTGGFKCFRREVLEAIDLDWILSDGYSFQVEMNYRTWIKKFRIKEIPIIFTDRRVGESKMTRKIIFEAIWMIWKLRWLHYRKKIK